MNSLPVKKPKKEKQEDSDAVSEDEDAQTERREQEEVLLALIEHRTKEVERNKWRVSHYTAELEQSERKLEETKSQLARLRGQDTLLASRETAEVGTANVKVEKRSASPTIDVKKIKGSTLLLNGEGSSQNKIGSRSQLVIPAVSPLTTQSSKSHLGTTASNSSVPRSSELVPTHANSTVKLTGEKSRKVSSDQEIVDKQSKGTKRKFEQKEHQDLIQLIGGSSSAHTIHCQTGSIIPCQHKRKLRSLVLCPTNDQLFVTSALDGVVNLWELQTRGPHHLGLPHAFLNEGDGAVTTMRILQGSSANFLSSTDCASIKQRRWPEDIAWHPHGKSVFSVFSADGGDSQVAVLDLNKAKERRRVTFLEDKPHVKGIINSIIFMPWEDTYFVTGGSDHAVVLWTEGEEINDWKPKALHRNLHSSAVMGVAGLQHKQVVVSAGADKRILGFDVLAGRADYKHQIESKCMSVVPNPCDFNLFMVQTGTPGKQLRLFDYRVRQMEIHAFGWEQETSESQSALINQAWSPDGLYITSGSADPMIHIFDIRYHAKKPTQSIRAHQKRVFKAVWHHTLPLLISISSDLNIGLHKII